MRARGMRMDMIQERMVSFINVSKKHPSTADNGTLSSAQRGEYLLQILSTTAEDKFHHHIVDNPFDGCVIVGEDGCVFVARFQVGKCCLHCGNQKRMHT